MSKVKETLEALGILSYKPALTLGLNLHALKGCISKNVNKLN